MDVQKNKIDKFRDELLTVVKVTLKNVTKRRVGWKSVKKNKKLLRNVQIDMHESEFGTK